MGQVQPIAGSESRASGRSAWKLATVLLIVAGLVAAVVLLPVKGTILGVLEWTQGLGVWGPIVVAAFYIAACVLLVPGSLVTLGAGVLFGVVVGTITVSIGSTLGACAAFLVGRTLARDWVAKKVTEAPKFAAIDAAVARQGFKIVFLTRLSPIFPFNLLNYAYGLTNVPFWKYALASWIGMLPGTIMYVYIGSAFKSLAEVAGEREKSALEHVFFWGGLVVAIVVAVFVTRVARRALKEAAPEIEAADGPPASQAGAGTEASHE